MEPHSGAAICVNKMYTLSAIERRKTRSTALSLEPLELSQTHHKINN
jgi:hypothetical protein